MSIPSTYPAYTAWSARSTNLIGLGTCSVNGEESTELQVLINKMYIVEQELRELVSTDARYRHVAVCRVENAA
jgi:hypothetical protein